MTRGQQNIFRRNEHAAAEFHHAHTIRWLRFVSSVARTIELPQHGLILASLVVPFALRFVSLGCHCILFLAVTYFL